MVDILKNVNDVTLVSSNGQAGSDTIFCLCRRPIKHLTTSNVDYNIDGSVLCYFIQSDTC